MKPSISTPITGLFVGSNKVVADDRGALFELIPGGVQEKFFHSRNVGNVYASLATKRLIPRAGHYHKECKDIFLTLAGTVLWYLEDFRKDSGTFGKTFAFTCGDSTIANAKDVPHLSKKENGVTFLAVPTGVYHLYFPLTAEPALVLGISSVPYNPRDYFDPVKNKEQILKRYINR